MLMEHVYYYLKLEGLRLIRSRASYQNYAVERFLYRWVNILLQNLMGVSNSTFRKRCLVVGRLSFASSEWPNALAELTCGQQNEHDTSNIGMIEASKKVTCHDNDNQRNFSVLLHHFRKRPSRDPTTTN